MFDWTPACPMITVNQIDGHLVGADLNSFGVKKDKNEEHVVSRDTANNSTYYIITFYFDVCYLSVSFIYYFYIIGISRTNGNSYIKRWKKWYEREVRYLRAKDKSLFRESHRIDW